MANFLLAGNNKQIVTLYLVSVLNKRFSDNKKALLYSFNLRITLQIREKITRVFVKL